MEPERAFLFNNYFTFCDRSSNQQVITQFDNTMNSFSKMFSYFSATYSGPLALKDTHLVIKSRQDVMNSSEFLIKKRVEIMKMLENVFDEIAKVE